MACATVAALPAERTRGAVQERAEQPVGHSGVEAAADEGPHCDDETVAGGIVEQRPRNRRREHACDPREPGDRQDRLLACLCGGVGVVPESREDGAWALEDEDRP